MEVEECLRVIEAKAALLRYLSRAASANSEHPDPEALAGMAEVSENIEDMAREPSSRDFRRTCSPLTCSAPTLFGLDLKPIQR